MGSEIKPVYEVVTRMSSINGIACDIRLRLKVLPSGNGDICHIIVGRHAIKNHGILKLQTQWLHAMARERLFTQESQNTDQSRHGKSLMKVLT